MHVAASEVEIFRGTGSELERGFYESALLEEGITCVIKSSGSISQHPISVGPMAQFSILVGPEDEERARLIIQRLREPEEWVDDEEPDDEVAPRGLLIPSEMTQSAKRIYRAIGLVGVAVALYLLIPYRDASLWGILLLIPAVILIAASARS
jgi:hypothetical protein